MAPRAAPQENPGDHLYGTPLGREQAGRESWAAFRAEHPARCSAQPLAGNPYKRPNKSGQSDWGVYTNMVTGTKIFQQHVIVPVLIPQPLAGPTPEVDGIRGTQPWRRDSDNTEHVTNIDRMRALLAKHPQVAGVETTKDYKANDPQTLEANGSGRCKGKDGAGHQSPFDLHAYLAASGAKMELGCTVNVVKARSIALWWKPLRPFTVEDIALSWE